MLNLNCVICAELFTQSDDVYATTCGHMFHYNCLLQWLERSKTCPQCRNKCTNRNIQRIYFNLSNLDTSKIDVGSLHEQLENANLKVKIKEKDLNKAEGQMKILKETQKKCMKTISGLEEKLKKNDFLILSYAEQVKILKADSKVAEDLRKETKALKQQIELMENVSSILVSSRQDAEKMLKTENDPKTLSVWVAALKRELRSSENKRTDLRNVLKVVQNDLRKEIELKKVHEERISQLESENYQLSEKIKTLESSQSTLPESSASRVGGSCLNESLGSLIRDHKRMTISPTIKDNVKKIEESNSPYLNIKSSYVGLVPLFKRHHDNANKNQLSRPSSSSTEATAGGRCSVGALGKVSSDLSEKYSMFKKPRLGLGASGNSVGVLNKKANFAFNGFGGSEKISLFDNQNEVGMDTEEEENRAFTKALSLSNRIKSGGLRNFRTDDVQK